MTTYIPFETALHMFTVAYMASIFALVVSSAVGLAVIETVEEVGEL